ncbi:DUF320-domain-containing protein [Conidiobolus coronatus NRRL 28638]|uniref:DUF320-domain-containing protein n=1 Tax=Conidiobolus coronatus (strain ATCC 28846 / CBS 209.66 / NRRL 28638) TaxID=796925 RepID=A0A137NT44_CONC2|nr:DUF320-domain-containing protein [Conidiobolus coronatus NRRL 28638]|eukprot:KXN65911.1 DUF320-domain-containing protein [Conidiobolus coronatus NRRL 28638]
MQLLVLTFLAQFALCNPAGALDSIYDGTITPPPVYPPPGTGVGDDNGDRGTPITATGASKSAGLLSGNIVQAPAYIPINDCGNTLDVIGLVNPAFGNNCENNTH